LSFQIRKRGEPQIDVKPEFTRVGDNVIVGSAAWLGADGRRHERFQVITLRDGKIADMQGCRSRGEAERVARQRVCALGGSGAR
jgi:hypothetical protein